MYNSLLLFAIFTYATAFNAPAPWRGPKPGEAIDAAKSLLNARADVNQLRLDRLVVAVEKAEAEYKKFVDGDDSHAIDHLEERVEHVTGTKCPMRQFQCGGLESQCISNLLVCDGSRDCNNGHDEEEETCVNLVTEGSSWSWNADWGNCISASAHTGKMLITSAKRSKSLSSRVKLGITVTTDELDFGRKDGDRAVTADGLWSFAGRKLVIYPGTPGFPATVCHFEKGNDKHCEGKLVKADTWEKCGTISATRLN